MSDYKRFLALERLIWEIRKVGYDKVCELSGIHYSTLIQWCNHKSYPTFDKVAMVAKAMGYEFSLVKMEDKKQDGE